MRYTPAGIPALDLRLAHESEVSEAGLPRKVALEIAAVALGGMAEAASSLALGTTATYSGFLSAGRNGKGLVFHVTAVD
jgi:primosomal replication protein N